jgi:hypothetical protein
MHGTTNPKFSFTTLVFIKAIPIFVHNIIFLIITDSSLSFGWPGSSVCIATKLLAGRSGDRIPVGGEIFLTCPDWPWGPPSLLYNGHCVFAEGKVRPGRDADHSPPSSADVLEEYSYTSTTL